jgi:hypothetical protein
MRLESIPFMISKNLFLFLKSLKLNEWRERIKVRSDQVLLAKMRDLKSIVKI